MEAASHLVCWSHVVRQSVIEDYGIAPERVSVIRPAVARHRLPPRSVPAADARKLRLLFVGNDFARKGGHDVLATFESGLRATCELDIVSNGIATLPAGAAARLHRGLSSTSAALAQLYADADVFVMPTHEDAFGIVFVEAMAAGLPCVGGRVLAVPELVQHGATGYCVTPGDRQALQQAIEALRDDAGLRDRMGLAGRDFAERECDEFTNCAQWGSLFRRLAAEADLPLQAQRVSA